MTTSILEKALYFGIHRAYSALAFAALYELLPVSVISVDRYIGPLSAMLMLWAFHSIRSRNDLLEDQNFGAPELVMLYVCSSGLGS